MTIIELLSRDGSQREPLGRSNLAKGIASALVICEHMHRMWVVTICK